MKWTLFDYGVGNLHSLEKALNAAGANTTITGSTKELADADIAVLPGVGAFGHVMQQLTPAVDDLRARHAAGKPILGICIGQQVMYEGSSESDAPGLGILPGHVARLDGPKIPHMGWNTLQSSDAMLDGKHVYYVHSYGAAPDDTTVATTCYDAPFAAAVRAGNTWGYQFHPEKSSLVGQHILNHTVQTLENA